jgi:TrpR family trp operon transcriptional repressor
MTKAHKNRDDIALLIKLMSAIDGSAELLEFLGAILTPAELKTMGERARIIERLLAGEKQRDIAKNIGAGLSTVSRGSRELKYGSGIFPLLFQRIQ